jgi:hypothetical protein
VVKIFDQAAARTGLRDHEAAAGFAPVAKRVDIAAAAIFHGMTVDQVSDLDLSYTPPLGSPGTGPAAVWKIGHPISVRHSAWSAVSWLPTT